MPIMYKCTWRGCSKVLDEQGYCKIHQDKIDKSNKQRYKVYQTNRIMDKEQKKYQRFYGTREWIRCRDAVIAKCYAIDLVEYYRTGKIVQGNTVHHIVELSEDYNLKLDTDNLIYLTDSNHSFVHREYNKGEREKKAMQKILIALKAKFKKEFRI